MPGIEPLVPPHEPAEDTLGTVGKMALSLIPGAGPLLAEGLGHALAIRQAERQHEFNTAVAREIRRVAEGLDSGPTLDEVLASDDFLAGWTRASRVAAETASESKRARLAAAVAHSGAWAVDFSARERAEFPRLVEDLDDLHVWLVHLLVEPGVWLRANGYERLLNQPDAPDLVLEVIMPGQLHWRPESDEEDERVVEKFGNIESYDEMFEEQRGALDLATDDLARAGLVGKLHDTYLSDPSGVWRVRTTDKGRRFLAFLNEPPSRDVASPSAI